MLCWRIASTFCLVLCCAAVGHPVLAQGAGFHQTNPPQPSKASNEITVSGVIHQVLTERPEGAPAGFNFVMTVSEKPMTVNAGPAPDDKIREQLHSGASVEVTGPTRTIKGTSYLLARELVVGGQTIQIRTRYGFPIHNTSEGSRAGVRSKRVESILQGGAR